MRLTRPFLVRGAMLAMGSRRMTKRGCEPTCCLACFALVRLSLLSLSFFSLTCRVLAVSLLCFIFPVVPLSPSTLPCLEAISSHILSRRLFLITHIVPNIPPASFLSCLYLFPIYVQVLNSPLSHRRWFKARGSGETARGIYVDTRYS